MPQTRRERKVESPNGIRLAHPDKSGPDPSRETLLEIAAKRGLPGFEDYTAGDQGGEEGEGKGKNGEELVMVGRVGESVLWCVSLAMLHFTLDTLVQHQYAEKLIWGGIIKRAVQSFGIFFLLFYSFHPHPEPSLIAPNIFPTWQPLLHQLFFFVGSVALGCHLIYITNMHGYIAVMKNAPGIGCLWIWSVIELDLKWALPSLLACIGFLKLGGFSYL